MSKKTIVSIIAVIAFLTVLAAVLLIVFTGEDPVGKNYGESSVPTPNQLIYGVKFEREVKHDAELMKSNLTADQTFAGYELKSQYKMIYQIRDEEAQNEIYEYLGVKEELPDIDYSKRYLLISVGCQASDIGKVSEVDVSGEKEDLLKVTYNTSEYTEGILYVYSMNHTKIISGKALDLYYWESASENSNFVESDYRDMKVLEEGKYYKVYERNDSLYEYVLTDVNGKAVRRNVTEANAVPAIKEISSTIMKIDYTDKTVYFNATTGIVSEEYTFETKHLIYNIITYMRIHNGETQLILRDAYDKTFYAKIVRLPFANVSEDALDTLVRSTTVIDDAHISVEYLNSENKWITETVEVYNMNRY